MHLFEVKTGSRECLVDITSRVQQAVAASGVASGVCTVYVPHTTAGVTINENADPDVCRDLLAFLGELVPRSWRFLHGEGNSDAHVKASLLGASAQIPVEGGRLTLGTWQGIFFAEFDGPRTRRVQVSMVRS
ncbi:MAG: secondary thiamine-phosphate synthase enzyme YjbQ [Deferrisomatales bacterium]|nr:secondary thiamine-phosphate synthase enzyme YjbQ [Deferrisomatales bacterium]